jgi:SAM-dependent methyltransferase
MENPFIFAARQALSDRSFDTAVRQATFAVKVAPEDGLAWRVLVLSMRAKGDFQAAMSAAEAGLLAAGEDAFLALQGGLAAAETGAWHRAWFLLERAFKQGGEDQGIAEAVADARSKAGLFYASAEVLEPLVYSRQCSAAGYRQYVHALFAAGENERGERAGRYILNFFPSDMELLHFVCLAETPPDDVVLQRMAASVTASDLGPEDGCFLVFGLSYAAQTAGEDAIAAELAERGRALARSNLSDPLKPDWSAGLMERVAEGIAVQPTVDSRLSLRRGEAAASRCPRPVFVLGHARSGKSRIAALLGRHEAVLNVDECALIQSALNDVYEGAPPITSDRDNERGTEALRSVISALAETRPGTEVVVFTTPVLLMFGGLLARLLPEARFVLAVRPTEEVIQACRDKWFRNGNEYALEDDALKRHVLASEVVLRGWERILGPRCFEAPFPMVAGKGEAFVQALFDHVGLSSAVVAETMETMETAGRKKPGPAIDRETIRNLPRAIDALVRAEAAVMAGGWMDESLNEVARLLPKSVRARTLRAEALAKGGKWRDALMSYREALSLRPMDKVSFDAYEGLRRAMAALPEEASCLALHEEILTILSTYRQDASTAFGDLGLPYQSLERLSIPGNRDTAVRLAAYDLGEPELTKGARVLDIGCHTGFIGIELASSGAIVEGFDFEAPLVDIANRVASYLGVETFTASVAEFETFEPTGEGYDLILSFAVHGWIGLSAEVYASRIREWLRPGGYILIESQGTRTPGLVEPGFLDYVARFAATGFQEIRQGELCDDGKITRLFVLLKQL